MVAEMATRTLDEWCALMDANDLPYAIACDLGSFCWWISRPGPPICFYEMELLTGAKRTHGVASRHVRGDSPASLQPRPVSG